MARSTYEKERQKEISKIRRRIRGIEERGYELKKPFDPTGKSLSQLRREYSIQNIYKKFTYESEGKRYSGTEYRKIERKQSARKGWETRRENQREKERQSAEAIKWEEMIFRNLNEVLTMIDDWMPYDTWNARVAMDKEKQRNTVRRMFNMLIYSRNKTYAALRINDNAQAIKEAVMRILYATYSDREVYSTKRRYYDPTEDYMLVERTLSDGIFTLEDIQKINETY